MIFFWYIFWSAKCVVFVFSVWDVCLFGDNYAGCSIFCAVFSKAENPKLLVILYYSMLNAGHPNAPNWSFALKGFVTWKKLFKRFTKGLEIHKKIPSFIPGIVVPVCFRKKKKEKKNVINGLLVVSQSPFANHNGFGVQAFDFAKEYFMAFKQPEAGVVTPRCSCAFPLGEIGREASPTGKRTQLPISQWFLKLNGAFDSHFFPPRLSKTTISKYHRKKYQQQLIQQTSANLRIRTNQQNPYHLKP